jgi:hypothetical protein
MSIWRGVLMGGGAMMLVAAAALGSVASPRTQNSEGAGEAGTMISIVPGSMNAAVGDDAFTVDVQVSNVNNLGAYSLTLRFDNERLEYTGAAGGSFLTSTGRTQQCVPAPANAVAFANQIGAFSVGCNTSGLVEDNVGKAGPNGTGVLFTFGFKPKAAGNASIELRGYSQHPVDQGPYAWEPQKYVGTTDLDAVEVCVSGSGCKSEPVLFGVENAVVQVTAAGEPTPTGVPATPTRVPLAPTPNVQATVQAVLTPSRRLTPEAGVTGSGGPTRGGTAAQAAGRQPTGQVAPGTGADGAPIAGHGPQHTSNEWPQRGGIALGLAGAAMLAAGLYQRRRNA